MPKKKSHYYRVSNYVKSFRAPTFVQRFQLRRRFRYVVLFVEKKPLTSFFISLAFLFFLILLGSILSNLGNKPQEKPVLVKDVSIYRLGKVPEVTLQGKVEKSGIVKLMAQTPGVVQTLHFSEGDTVEIILPMQGG